MLLCHCVLVFRLQGVSVCFTVLILFTLFLTLHHSCVFVESFAKVRMMAQLVASDTLKESRMKQRERKRKGEKERMGLFLIRGAIYTDTFFLPSFPSFSMDALELVSLYTFLSLSFTLTHLFLRVT